MSFPDYLRERLSEDYKNLIIQKLEEVKKHSEGLKEKASPSVQETGRSLQDRLQREITRIQEAMEAELNLAQERMLADFSTLVDESSSSWYHSDLSAYDQQLDILVSDIVSNIPVPPKKEHPGLVSLVDLMKKLDAGATQSEILNIVLQHISGWVDRAVLFVVKGEQAAAWAAFGLDPSWDVARIRQIKTDLGQDSVLRKATSGEAAYGAADEFSQNADLFSLLGEESPAAALAFPIFVRGKIAGILYADVNDSLVEQPDLPNLLHLAARSAGFAVDLLPTKPKVAAAAAAPAPAKPAPVPPPETVAITMPLIMAAAPASSESTAPTVMMNFSMPPAPAPAMQEIEGTVIMQSPLLREPAVISEEDQKFHEDAKRFARLLVSEIKLYNEAQVSAGRERRDLYDRLKDDIERSRRMYTDRVPEHIHTTTNYFYEELVRTLANGDPTLLGM